MRQGRPKMDQLASKVSQEEPNWAHMGPLLPTLEAVLPTWGIPLRIFRHFCKVFVNTCAFIVENPEKFSNLQQKLWILHKNTEKVLKPAQKCVEVGQKWPSWLQKWARRDENEPTWAHFCPLWMHSWPLGACSYAFSQVSIRFSWTFVHFCWKFMGNPQKFSKLHQKLWILHKNTQKVVRSA